MVVSWNRGIPKSSIFMGFSLKPTIWGYPYFRKPPYIFRCSTFLSNYFFGMSILGRIRRDESTIRPHLDVTNGQEFQLIQGLWHKLGMYGVFLYIHMITYVCMYIYIYYTYVYVYVYIHMYIYICIYTYVYIFIHIHVYIYNTYICVYVYIYIYMCFIVWYVAKYL